MSAQKEIPEIHSSIGSLIKSFFETLTPDQLPLLIAGTLDESIKALMVNLISQIIQNLSTVLQTYIRTMGAEVTQELIQSSLGNAVTESFKAALSVTDRGQSRSAEVLRDMISEEVLVTVQCSMSDTPNKHVPTPKRLEKMLKLASRMIKSIKNRVSCKKGEDLKPSEPTTSTEIYIFNENPLDSFDAIPMDFSSESPLHSSDEFIMDVSDKFPMNVPEQKPLVVSEAIPLDVFEEIPLDVSEFTSPTPSDHLMEESRKHAVLLIVERLVSLTYSKSKVSYYMDDPAILIKRLVERTLAAVEGVDFDPFSKTNVDLEKAIHKDLMEKWGSALLVLTHMKLGSVTLEKFIADAIKTHLMPPKRCRCTRELVLILNEAYHLLWKVNPAPDSTPT